MAEEMKTLTISGTTFEVVDDAARNDIDELRDDISDIRAENITDLRFLQTDEYNPSTTWSSGYWTPADIDVAGVATMWLKSEAVYCGAFASVTVDMTDLGASQNWIRILKKTMSGETQSVVIYQSTNTSLSYDISDAQYIKVNIRYGDTASVEDGDKIKITLMDGDLRGKTDGAVKDLSNAIVHRGRLTADNFLYDIVTPGMWYITASNPPADYPSSVSGRLVVFGSDNVSIKYTKVQLIIDNDGTMYYRIGITQTTWSSWTVIPGKINGTMLALGTSITYGEYAGGGAAVSPYNWPAMVGRKLGLDVTNYGKRGYGLIKNWEENIALIDTLDTSYKLVCTQWGGNDIDAFKAMPMGTYLDTGIDTVMGYFYTYHKALAEKIPNAVICIISGIGVWAQVGMSVRPDVVTGYDAWWEYNGERLVYRALNEEIGKMAQHYGWMHVNLCDNGFLSPWNYTNMLYDSNNGSYSHPTAEAYKIYGNVVASRVSALFGNNI